MVGKPHMVGSPHTWWLGQAGGPGGAPGRPRGRAPLASHQSWPSHHVCELPTICGFPTMYLGSPPFILIKGISYQAYRAYRAYQAYRACQAYQAYQAYRAYRAYRAYQVHPVMVGSRIDPRYPGLGISLRSRQNRHTHILNNRTQLKYEYNIWKEMLSRPSQLVKLDHDCDCEG